MSMWAGSYMNPLVTAQSLCFTSFFSCLHLETKYPGKEQGSLWESSNLNLAMTTWLNSFARTSSELFYDACTSIHSSCVYIITVQLHFLGKHKKTWRRKSAGTFRHLWQLEQDIQWRKMTCSSWGRSEKNPRVGHSSASSWLLVFTALALTLIESQCQSEQQKKVSSLPLWQSVPVDTEDSSSPRLSNPYQITSRRAMGSQPPRVLMNSELEIIRSP